MLIQGRVVTGDQESLGSRSDSQDLFLRVEYDFITVSLRKVLAYVHPTLHQAVVLAFARVCQGGGTQERTAPHMYINTLARQSYSIFADTYLDSAGLLGLVVLASGLCRTEVTIRSPNLHIMFVCLAASGTDTNSTPIQAFALQGSLL